MDERDIRDLIDQVRSGGLPRRSFIGTMVSLGLTAPMASMLLMQEGIAQEQPKPLPYKPVRRGGGGLLKMLSWSGVVHLNPHFASGRKDADAARIFYEPLATWDSEGNLVPVLAAEVPSRANGGLAADARSVTWKLKQGVTWHDGKPFTADDVVFTWEYSRDPATGTVTVSSYRDIRVEKVDAHAVRVVFPKPTAFWAEAYTGILGAILPKHVFEPYIGAKSRESPNNNRPVGTGPYKLVEFTPGDMLKAEINRSYHMPNRPHFDALEVKSGGEATTAARAVLQTGDYDFAGLLSVDDELLRRMEQAGRGRIVIKEGEWVEHILLNCTDPWTEADGERASAKSRHPAFSDKAVRDAMALLIDRDGMQRAVYGRLATVSPNFLNIPPRYRSPNMKHEFDIVRANQVLDAAGWLRGADGLRAKGGVKLKFVFMTMAAAPSQKLQAIIKDACGKAGIDLELKAVQAAIMFGGDPANPDNYKRFLADMLMYAFPGQPDPQFLMAQFCSWDLAQKANQWASLNIPRWRNDEYDRAFRAAEAEMDPVKRAALFIRMNDIVCGDRYVIPLASRGGIAAVSTKLAAPLSSLDVNMCLLPHWYRHDA